MLKDTLISLIEKRNSYIYLYFLKVRILMVSRLMKDLGILRSILLIGFTVSLFFDYRIAFISALLLPLFWHFQRKDRDFIAHLSLSQRNVFLIEYIFISSPVLIYLLVTVHILLFGALLIYLFLISGIPFLKISPKKALHSLPLISSSLFEWKRGFRKSYKSFLLVYLPCIIFSKNEFITPSVIIIISIFISSMYDTCEPVFYLITEQRSPVQFLFYKCKKAITFYLFLISPLCLVYFLFHFKLLTWLLFAFFGGSFLIIESILLKYALYAENKRISYFQAYILMISLVALYYAPPLPFIIVIWLYLKSTRKLQFYLNA